jgi:periplasmic divalent cation tolerance protein
MLVGWTTAASREDAEKLATGAVERRLAACAHVDGPFLSVYFWKGVLQKEEEYRVTFKFLSQKTPALENWLRDNHPYENYQWVAVAAERISQNYLIWAQKETT